VMAEVMMCIEFSRCRESQNRSAFHATVSTHCQASKYNLEQLFKSPRTVTNALDWHAGLVSELNKRSTISSRGARKLVLPQHQQREKP